MLDTEVVVDGPFSCRSPTHRCCKGSSPNTGLTQVPGEFNLPPSRNLKCCFLLFLSLLHSSPFPLVFLFLSSTLWTNPASSLGVQLGFELVKNNTDVIGKVCLSPNSILFSSRLSVLLFPSCSVFFLSVMHTHTHTEIPHCSASA